MKPGERIEIKKKLAAELAKREWTEIDLILSEFNQPVTDMWEGNGEEAYVLDMLTRATDEDLTALAEYVLGTPVAPMPEGAGPWRDDSFRLFLTHLAREKEFVAAVQTVLQWEGIDSFVAHNDIEPSAEWVQTINMALWTCDGLAAFLHDGFNQSLWCDQEVGFVFGRRKPLIPVAIDVMPYGFLGLYQALLCKGQRPAIVARKIVDTLLGRPDSREAIIDAQLSAFVGAHSFDHANGICDRLRPVMTDRDWTRARLDKVELALKNGQVTDGWRAGPWAQDMLDRHRLPPPPASFPGDDNVPF